MSVLDVRGRLFGRWNLIDAAALVAVGLLMMLGYGAYLLFRMPTPIIDSITPAQVVARQAGTLRVTGTRLRPLLTVRLGSSTTPLLVASSTMAEVNVKDLAPGTYDFVLLDEARELVRVPGAVTVVPPVSAASEFEMEAVGAFVFLAEPDAARIAAGVALDEEFRPGEGPSVRSGAGTGQPVGTVVAVRPPEISRQQVHVADGTYVTTGVSDKLQVPAVVRWRCALRGRVCLISGTEIESGTLVPLTLSVPADKAFTQPATRFLFRVDELRVATGAGFPAPPRIATATVRVKFVARVEVAGLPSPGDKDVSVRPGEDISFGTAGPHTATIVSVDTSPVPIAAATQVDRVTYQQTMMTFDATLRVPVVLMPTGWEYAGRPVKVGVPLRFEGRTYAMDGWVLSVQTLAAIRTKAR